MGEHDEGLRRKLVQDLRHIENNPGHFKAAYVARVCGDAADILALKAEAAPAAEPVTWPLVHIQQVADALDSGPILTTPRATALANTLRHALAALLAAAEPEERLAAIEAYLTEDAGPGAAYETGSAVRRRIRELLRSSTPSVESEEGV